MLRALVCPHGGKSSVNLETNAPFEAGFNGVPANAGGVPATARDGRP